jgi:DNA-binding winged helix-turn-helix (wHTH) protein
VLSPIETTIVALLLGNFGRLVSKDAVISAVWEDGRAHALNTRLHRLRDRLAVVGLRLVTVRGRGFVLECDVTEDG